MPEIRDPVHGFISVTKDELKIIDSVPFQRLRRIHQLGTTYLLYPSAEHTRFAHSIGVMHVSTLIYDKLIEKRRDVLGWDNDTIQKYRQMLRAASLLHDIAHAPFSHVSDDLFDNNVKSHEGMAGKIIVESEIASIIERIGKDYGFGPSDIAALITEKSFRKEERLITNIFSSELDSDKMDYLLRDSLYTGVKYGNFDLDRILNVLTLFPTEEGSWSIGVEYDGVEAVEGLILARYFMFAQVYLHRTRRIYDHIMIHILKEILKERYSISKLPGKVDEFIQWDDYTIIEYAKKNKTSPWADRFLNRKHLKRVWETEPRPTEEEKQIHEEIKKGIEEKFNSHQVIVDKYQKAPIKFNMPDGTPTINILSKDTATKAYSFQQKAPIAAKLEEPIYIFRVYADNEISKEVKEFIELKYAILKGGNNK